MIFSKDTLLDSNIYLDVLKLTMLIYNYNRDFDFNKEDDSSNILKNISFDDINMSALRKEIFVEICENSPNGKLLHFYNNIKNDLQGAMTISHKHKRICVIFRGSTSNKDWFYNLNIHKTKLRNNIYVHTGFYKQLNDNGFCNKILSDLLVISDKYHDYNIYVSGHSLGGGLASIFSYILSSITEKNITLITFASPRTGNLSWCKSFNNKNNLRHYRFINNNDIVTSIPYFCYYHTGNVMLFKESNCYYTKYYDYKDTYCNWFCCKNSISDHSLEKYYYKILLHVNDNFNSSLNLD